MGKLMGIMVSWGFNQQKWEYNGTQWENNWDYNGFMGYNWNIIWIQKWNIRPAI
jgi:hypothetical protein